MYRLSFRHTKPTFKKEKRRRVSMEALSQTFFFFACFFFMLKKKNNLVLSTDWFGKETQEVVCVPSRHTETHCGQGKNHTPTLM